jgi:hypothetical protein
MLFDFGSGHDSGACKKPSAQLLLDQETNLLMPKPLIQ